MKSAQHIVIIGGGLIGLSSADSLLKRGINVTILERTKIPGRGSAQYNSGMIHPSQATPWLGNKNIATSKKVLKLAKKSQFLLNERRRNLGCCDIDRPGSTLKIFENADERDSALALYEDLGIMTNSEESEWSFGRPAIRFPEDESGDAYEYMQRLSYDLAKRGCVFETDVRVKPVMENNRIVGVAAAHHKLLPADGVVIAAGVQSKFLAADLGISLPLQSMQGHALLFDRPTSVSLPPIPVMHAFSHSALTVFENHVRLSGTLNEETPEILIEIWRDIAPDIVFRLGAPKFQWSASRPMSLLGRPMIGPTSIDGLWLNTGHGHMGWSLCTASGELLADLLTGDLKSSDFAVPV